VDEVTNVPKSRGELTMMSSEQGRPEYKLQKPLEEMHKLIREIIEDDDASEQSKVRRSSRQLFVRLSVG
jgi:hypothetical protein